jgi:hypothetical protein
MSLQGAMEDHWIIIRGRSSDVSESVCALKRRWFWFSREKRSEAQNLGKAPERLWMLLLKVSRSQITGLKRELRKKRASTHMRKLSLPRILDIPYSCMFRESALSAVRVAELQVEIRLL